jgi:hypothetical protein
VIKIILSLASSLKLAAAHLPLQRHGDYPTANRSVKIIQLLTPTPRDDPTPPNRVTPSAQVYVRFKFLDPMILASEYVRVASNGPALRSCSHNRGRLGQAVILAGRSGFRRPNLKAGGRRAGTRRRVASGSDEQPAAGRAAAAARDSRESIDH